MTRRSAAAAAAKANCSELPESVELRPKNTTKSKKSRKPPAESQKKRQRAKKAKSSEISVKQNLDEVEEGLEESEEEWEDVVGVTQSPSVAIAETNSEALSQSLPDTNSQDFTIELGYGKKLSLKERQELYEKDALRKWKNQLIKRHHRMCHIIELQYNFAKSFYLTKAILALSTSKAHDYFGEDVINKLSMFKNSILGTRRGGDKGKEKQTSSEICHHVLKFYRDEDNSKLFKGIIEVFGKFLNIEYPNLTLDHFADNRLKPCIIVFFLLNYCGIDSKLCFALVPSSVKIDLEKPEFVKSTLNQKFSQISVDITSPGDTKSIEPVPSVAKKASKQKPRAPKKSKEPMESICNSVWIEVDLGFANSPPLLIFNTIDMSFTDEFLPFLSTLDQKQFGYIFAIDNCLECADVTLRYSQQWSHTRHIQKESEYFSKLIDLHCSKEIFRQKERSLTFNLVERYLRPSTSVEIKLHPLYVIEKDILKYQSINPNTRSVFTIKDQNVYYRQDITELHTRDKWIQFGMQIKQNEVPFKQVKSTKRTKSVEDKQIAELFGHWQVEKFKPPICENGIVPKNDYGNVYLFFPYMLPINATHVQLPKVMRIASRLKIDFAPAMVGWSVTGGHSHPIIDGIVIATENYDKLLANWKQSIRRQNMLKLLNKYSDLQAEWSRLLRSLKTANRLENTYSQWRD